MRFLESLVELNEVQGLSILIENGSIAHFSLVHLKKSKESVQIVQMASDSAIEKLNLNVDVPLVLNLHGEGIVIKNLRNTTIVTDKDIFNFALPSAKWEDFGVQIVRQEYVYCALMRIEKINELIDGIEQHNKNIIGLSLASFPVIHLIEILKHPNFIIAGNTKFDFEGNSLSSVETSSEQKEYVLDEYRLDSAALAAFAVSYQCFLNEIDFIGVRDFRENERKDSAFKFLYNRAKLFVPLFFLLLLLVNFFVFSSLSRSNNNLAGKLEVNRHLLDELNKLKGEVQLKESFLTSGDWFERSNASFYSDRIGASVEEGLALTQLNLYPITEEKDGSWTYEADKVIVKGETNSALILSDWTNRLEQKEWVNEIVISDYKQENMSTSINFEAVIYLLDQKNEF